ncbi:MAG: 30S ribosome-binding factor RbfA [Bacteroidetes bacterium]|nr:30S ribosome-binding factor RbfA [Bacteroidota bacterium]
METTRQHKISRLLQKDLSDIFQKESKSLFGGAMITVTKVHVTSDLSVAKIYISLFATSNKDELMKTIQHHSKELRFKLGRRIGRQIRVVPDLHFFIDDSLDYIEKIEKLLEDKS